VLPSAARRQRPHAHVRQGLTRQRNVRVRPMIGGTSRIRRDHDRRGRRRYVVDDSSADRFADERARGSPDHLVQHHACLWRDLQGHAQRCGRKWWRHERPEHAGPAVRCPPDPNGVTPPHLCKGQPACRTPKPHARWPCEPDYIARDPSDRKEVFGVDCNLLSLSTRILAALIGTDLASSWSARGGRWPIAVPWVRPGSLRVK